MYNNTSLIQPEVRTDFNRLISIMTSYNYYTEPENIDKIGEKVLKKYFPSGGIDDHSHINAVKVGTIINNKIKTLNYFIIILHNRCMTVFQMFTDSCFTECVIDMAYKLSSPVYGYFYNYQNEFSYNKVFGSCERPLGVTHGDELNSIFKMNSLNPNDLNEKDLEVSKLVINIWYKFIESE